MYAIYVNNKVNVNNTQSKITETEGSHHLSMSIQLLILQHNKTQT